MIKLRQETCSSKLTFSLGLVEHGITGNCEMSGELEKSNQKSVDCDTSFELSRSEQLEAKTRSHKSLLTLNLYSIVVDKVYELPTENLKLSSLERDLYFQRIVKYHTSSDV